MDKKLKTIFISILLALAFIALLDITFMRSGVFGNACDYTNGNYLVGTWPLFYKIAMSIMVLFPIGYYFLYRRDLSESLAIFVGSQIMWRFGLSDILYFWLQGKALPKAMPWLTTNFPINIFGAVTNITLLLSATLGILITYFVVKFLKEKL